MSAKNEIPFDVEALDAAYEICFLIRDHARNVIASGDFGESDKDNEAKADKFIRAYKRTIKKLQKLQS